ncbi:MAG: hypothetical protein HFF08_07930 [Oscillospiraceae bacterium]|nr:hypothetical protein [Oscillospiraceae bacterium]
MKKRQYLFLPLIGIILFLAACSNKNAVESDRDTIQLNVGIQGEESGGEDRNREDSPAMPAVDKERAVTEKTESRNEVSLEADAEKTQSEHMDGYPSAAEISAALADKKGLVYWLAPDPAVPNVCSTLNAETANTEKLWDAIHDRVFENANLTVQEMPEEYPYRCYQFNWNDQSWDLTIGSISIELRSDASLDEDTQESILDILTEWTGMGISFKTGEINHYAFTYNDLVLDEYGYSLGGDEWIPDSIISLGDNRISICNPVVIQSDCETIGTETLLTMDSARAICEAYYRAAASGVPSVSIITDVELVYYFADDQLLPAWRLTGQQYMTPNGHELSMLLDAVSGEIIRHA